MSKLIIMQGLPASGKSTRAEEILREDGNAVRINRDQLRYAILDDESDMLLWQKDHFFQTSFENGGLTEEIAKKVTEHLNV